MYGKLVSKQTMWNKRIRSTWLPHIFYFTENFQVSLAVSSILQPPAQPEQSLLDKIIQQAFDIASVAVVVATINWMLLTLNAFLKLLRIPVYGMPRKEVWLVNVRMLPMMRIASQSSSQSFFFVTLKLFLYFFLWCVVVVSFYYSYSVIVILRNLF